MIGPVDPLRNPRLFRLRARSATSPAPARADAGKTGARAERTAARFPVTRMLARRLDQRISEPPVNLVAQSGIIAKETGEAISAILTAEESLDGQERARAITEIDEAIVALRAARARLEQPAAALVSVQS